MQRQSPGQGTLTITGEAPEAEDSSALEHLKDDKFSSSVTTVECRNATQLQLKIARDATTRGGSIHIVHTGYAHDYILIQRTSWDNSVTV